MAARRNQVKIAECLYGETHCKFVTILIFLNVFAGSVSISFARAIF